MSSPPDQDIKALLDLGNELQRLVGRRDAIRALIEPKSARRNRTANLAISTIVTAGSLIFAAITPWSLIAAPYGIWRLIRTIEEDSTQENRQAALRRELKKVERDLTEVEIKYAAIVERLRRRPP